MITLLLLVAAGGFALTGAGWLVYEARHATRQPVASPVEAIFVDEPEPSPEPEPAPEPEPEPMPEPEREPRPKPVVSAPVLELATIGTWLEALTDAVERLAERIDAHTATAVPAVPAAEPEPEPEPEPATVPATVSCTSLPAVSDDLLAWPSDEEINRFYGYERGRP